MSIAIIDYGSGNLRSAEKAFHRAASIKSAASMTRAASIKSARKTAPKVQVTHDADVVARADYIVLPGVGAFGDCVQGLRALDGMEEALTQRVCRDGRPFLGICIGMHLMCETGLERGPHDGLGWIEGVVCPLEANDNLKVPHMGWNELRLNDALGAPQESGHCVLAGLDGADMYFVHSFVARPSNPQHIAATVDYGAPLVAALARDNMIGTQFHPEKSQQAGLRLIANFLAWKP